MFTAEATAKKRMAAARGETYEEEQTGHSNFDAGRDMDSRFLDVFREAGFNQVKRWYQAQNHVFRTGEEFMGAPINNRLSSLEPDVKEALKSTYDDLSGANTEDLRVFEVMIVMAFKD